MPRHGRTPTTHLAIREDGTKACPKCQRILPLHEYAKELRVAAKVRRMCRTCERAAVRDKAAKWAEQNRGSLYQAVRRYHKANPDRRAAHLAVSYRVKVGHMPAARCLPCSDCGDVAAHYDHYRGYAKKHQLDVEPVCVSCHFIRERRRRGNAPQAACWFDLVEGAAPCPT